MSIKTEGGIQMETERYSFIKWVKVHKKSLLLAGISVTAIIGVIFVPTAGMSALTSETHA